MSTNEDAIDSAASISDRYRRESRPGRRPRPARLECAETRGDDGRDGEGMAGSTAGSGRADREPCRYVIRNPTRGGDGWPGVADKGMYQQR